MALTTTDRLFRYQSAGEHADSATREALRHGRALREDFPALKQYPLSTRTAQQVCIRIKGVETQISPLPPVLAPSSWRSSEILYSLNMPDDFILAIVEFTGEDTHRYHHLRQPFPARARFRRDQRESYDFSELSAPAACLIQANARCKVRM